MRVYLFILAVLVVALPAISSADTFTVETVTGTTTATSTITLSLPSVRGVQSPSDAVASIITQMGGNVDTLELLTAELNSISTKVLEAISVEPVDIEALSIEAQKLVDLALRLQLFVLKDKLADVVKVSGVDDSWFTEILNNF